ncbi:hypothetical protein O9H85_17325 [Paenibacillus filicis]|uniref:ISXO2-like transposase domain-containing protein n=1 Tax=Paenibacillus gyeongsangnamensis TaxID=3388067 RepID=A0ABT4QB94_9BACL|nr:hypothetical protein [Paenibacillus filicis]MCZ8514155.1 hypothetical protein [Paenibacillus filicis]
MQKWFAAIYFFSRSNRGTSAAELSRLIKVTYKTAWLILHKIRHAISEADHKKLLSGIIRVNAAVHGKPDQSSIIRHHREQPLFVASAEDTLGCNPAPYFKMKLIPDHYLNEKTSLPTAIYDFRTNHIDSHVEHIQIVTRKYDSHRFKNLLTSVAQAGRWLTATYHGIGRKYLQFYLDEYCFRMNCSDNIYVIFKHLTSMCVSNKPITYRKLIYSNEDLSLAIQW